MSSLLKKLLSEKIEKSVVPISGQLSLDFTHTKHTFRKLRKGLLGAPANILFMTSTQDYKDLMDITVFADQSIDSDSEITMYDLAAAVIRVAKERDSTFEAEDTEVVMSKGGDTVLGVLVTGTESMDKGVTVVLQLHIPTMLKYKNDSSIALTARFPKDSPASLKEDYLLLLRSTDIHTDQK